MLLQSKYTHNEGTKKIYCSRGLRQREREREESVCHSLTLVCKVMYDFTERGKEKKSVKIKGVHRKASDARHLIKLRRDKDI